MGQELIGDTVIETDVVAHIESSFFYFKVQVDPAFIIKDGTITKVITELKQEINIFLNMILYAHLCVIRREGRSASN